MHSYLRRSLFVLPNLFTLASISCGFYAIVLCATCRGIEPGVSASARGGGADDALYQASLLIIFAMFFDMIDGRVARLTRTQSAFGMQIDSLADVLSFGAAPALLVYVWSLAPLGFAGRRSAFSTLRRVDSSGALQRVVGTCHGAPEEARQVHPGPADPGRCGHFGLARGRQPRHRREALRSAGPIAVGVVALSFFMVSTIRFRSFKDLRLSLRTVVRAVVASVAVVLAIKLHVAFALGWMLISYVAVGLVESTVGLVRRTIHRAPGMRLSHDDPAKIG